MKFSQLVKYLASLEKTTKRLEIVYILSNLIKSLKIDESDKAIYLVLGQLGPLHDLKKLNLAEKQMIKIIASAFNKPVEEITRVYKKTGDLGNVAEKLGSSIKIRNPDITSVYNKLVEIADITGSTSQDLKTKKYIELLNQLDSTSRKYIIRISLGKLRLGFSESSILDALAKLAKLKNKAIIEENYNTLPDIGLLVKTFKQSGVQSLKRSNTKIGTPVLPQLCERIKKFEEALSRNNYRIAVENKYDGLRLQLHKSKKLVKTFTRNLEINTYMFPDLINAAKKELKVDSVVLDGEVIGIDKKTDKIIGFQETITRKRKYGVEEKSLSIPIRYYVFDILYLNGKSVIDKPFSERRKMLTKLIKKKNIIQVADQSIVNNLKDLISLFKQAKKDGYEGLVVKSLDSKYKAGKRGFSWIKLKRLEETSIKDTADVVIFGYYAGRGKLAKFGIGGFLVGSYDKSKDQFLTLSRVGSGLSDNEWKTLKKELDKIKLKYKPSNVNVDKTLYCDVWVKPKLVVELTFDEISRSTKHTSGLSLRFPRLVNFRFDKDSSQTTTINELKNFN